MSVQNFIPELWAASLLGNIHKAHVYANELVVNRDYEGQIKKFGDTVRINAIGPVTVSDYAHNTDIAAPQALESAETILAIDQAKYFNFAVDDVDAAQANVNIMESGMEEAGYAVADVTDIYLAALGIAAVSSTNTIGSTGSPKTDLATDKVPYGYGVALAQKLDEASIPQNGRWVIVPPWFYAYIRKDSNFLHSTTMADLLLRTGRMDPNTPVPDLGALVPQLQGTPVGMIAGLTVFMSNNVPNTNSTAYQILAGHRIAWSFAEQVIEIEGYRPPYRFADAVKGLHVYGSKVTRPNALAVLIANPT